MWPLAAFRRAPDGTCRRRQGSLGFPGGVAPATFSCSRRYKTISKENLINEEIRDKEVRLIGSDGTQFGVVSINEAMERANEAKLDLVNISPNAKPPVCKLLDYGKYRYELQKREKEAKKKQKSVQVKEVRLGIFTEEHDLTVKANNAVKFLKSGDKVKVSLRFRGRELGHIEQGRKTMSRFIELTAEAGTPEKRPEMEGRSLSMILVPKTDK